MQLSIKADSLKEMVARAIKGVGNNKLIPLTSLMCISVDNGVLTLVTTDATNYLYIRKELEDADDFYAVVPVDVFSKLVARMTCEKVTLSVVQGKILEVKGNGTYSIELPVDESGNAVRYPDPMAEVKLEGEGKEIKAETIRSILNSVKPSLAVTLELPCYTGYYLGDRVFGTNTYKIACLDVKLVDKPILVAADTMNLLAVMTADKVKMDVLDEALVFTSPDCWVYSSKMPGIEEFQIDAINDLVDTAFANVVELPKPTVLQILDRLSLFVSPYDKNGINLDFTDKELQISSKTSNGVETIPYSAANLSDTPEFSCEIDIEFFTTQVKAQTGNVIKLFYGEENSIKMVDGDLTQIVALMEESDS